MTLREINLHLAIELARTSNHKGLYSDRSSTQIVELIRLLNRYSRAQHRMAEDQCNRPWGPREHARQKVLHKGIVTLCEINELTWEIHSDPRAGCGLTVTVKSGRNFHLANSQGR